MIISDRKGFWYSFWGGFLTLYVAIAAYRSIDLYVAGVHPTSAVFIGTYIGYMAFSPWWLPLYVLAGIRQGLRRAGNRAVILSANSEDELRNKITRHKKNARKVYLLCAVLTFSCVGFVGSAYDEKSYRAPDVKFVSGVISGITGSTFPPEVIAPYLLKLGAISTAYFVSDILFMTWWANRRINEL